MPSGIGIRDVAVRSGTHRRALIEQALAAQVRPDLRRHAGAGALPESADVPPAGNEEVRLAVRLVDAEADDPPGMDADDRVTLAGCQARRVADGLGGPADLQAPHSPWLPGDDVVDDEGDPAVFRHIAELPAGRHVVAADVDRGQLLVVAKADRVDLRSAIRL